MKETRVLLYCFLMCAVTGGLLVWYMHNQQKKIAVVDAVRLFDQYNLKNELEAAEKKNLEAIKKKLDSVENQLKAAKVTQDEETIKRLAYASNYVKAELETQFRQGNRAINEQVWKRLNPAVTEFGKEKKLHVIIGANGMGSVLYNDEVFDLTGDVIKYVNKKYEEGN